MPEMAACLANAVLGGKTRFSWRIDSIVFVAIHSSGGAGKSAESGAATGGNRRPVEFAPKMETLIRALVKFSTMLPGAGGHEGE
jgi:hypothetical protein